MAGREGVALLPGADDEVTSLLTQCVSKKISCWSKIG